MEVSRAVLVGIFTTIAQFSFLVSIPDIWRGMDIRLRSPWSRVSDPGREKRFEVSVPLRRSRVDALLFSTEGMFPFFVGVDGGSVFHVYSPTVPSLGTSNGREPRSRRKGGLD